MSEVPNEVWDEIAHRLAKVNEEEKNLSESERYERQKRNASLAVAAAVA